MQILLRSIGLVILLALCWALWRVVAFLLQGTPLALYEPIAAVVAIMLMLTFVEWAHEKYRAEKR